MAILRQQKKPQRGNASRQTRGARAGSIGGKGVWPGGRKRSGRIGVRRPKVASDGQWAVSGRWLRSGREGLPSRGSRERGERRRSRSASSAVARALVGPLVVRRQPVYQHRSSALRRTARCRSGRRAMPAVAGAVQRILRKARGPAGRPRAADAASLTPPPRSPDATRAAHTRPAAPSGPHAARPRSRCRAPSRGSGRHCARSTAGAR